MKQKVIYLDKETHSKLKVLAALEGKTISNMAIILINDYIEKTKTIKWKRDKHLTFTKVII